MILITQNRYQKHAPFRLQKNSTNKMQPKQLKKQLRSGNKQGVGNHLFTVFSHYRQRGLKLGKQKDSF